MELSTPDVNHQQSPLVGTGVTGLDDILFGGLPPGQTYLIEGDPGTGKTTLAMQFMQEGLRLGESCLYVTFSESRRDLLTSSRSHGWSNEPHVLEITPSQNNLDEGERYTLFHPSEVEIGATMRRLIEEIERLNPTRLVCDSLAELKLLAGDAVRYRRQLLALRQFLEARNSTVLLLDDRTANGNGDSDLQLHSITHGVVRLEKLPRTYGVTRRHLEVVKLRGTAYREGFHDYTIQRGGLQVYPRSTAAEHAGEEYTEQAIQSNLSELDLLLGGGIDAGSSTLILGPTGVGKSTFALLYAFAATQRGERALYYAFDETARTIRIRAKRFGMNLDSEIQQGTLHLQQMNPAELSPGEFVFRIRNEVEHNRARVIVIDSLNGFLHAMPGENDLLLQMHELLSFLSEKGVTVFLILTQHGLMGTVEVPIDISYLADNLLLLRFFEAEGSVRRAISAVKKRTGPHEQTIREYKFDSGGIHIGEPLVQFRGVLTGVPEHVGSVKHLLKEPSDGVK